MIDSPKQPIILLIGSLGSGKTLVLDLLSEKGCATLDLGQVVHDMYARGGAAYEPILHLFGAKILDSNGEIDRVQLNREIRETARGTAELRAILAPLVRQHLARQSEASNAKVTFVAASEGDLHDLQDIADQVWALSASPETRIRNLIQHHGWTQAAAAKFVRSNLSAPGRPAWADVMLAGDSLSDLRQQITDELRGLELAVGQDSTSLAPIGLPALDEVLSGNLLGASTAVPKQTLEKATAARVEPRNARASAPATPVSRDLAALGLRELRFIGRRLISSALILLSIAFLTSLGLILAEYGRQHLPIRLTDAALAGLQNTASYVLQHPATYVWSKTEVPWLSLVGETLGRSAALLLLSMSAAVILGFPLGMAAARIRRGPASVLILLTSVAGASTPSFFLGMVLWAANVSVHRLLDIKVLPASGFGFDGHMVMPMLVLAMRPLAQVAQITYVSIREALGQDYVRTAQSKGLTWRAVQFRHLLPNVLIPVLTTLGTSLRYSLSSLPIVEIFFGWPGVGMRLLDAIAVGNGALVVDLILSLGLFFLAVNLLIEFTFPIIDPRLRSDATEENRSDAGSLSDWARQGWDILKSVMRDMGDRLRRRGPADLPPLPASRQAALAAPEVLASRRRSTVLRNALGNGALMIGIVGLLFLAALAAFGEQLPGVEPYQVHGVMKIAGEMSAPPFKPSPEFAWGSDHIGRDMRSLVLAGARRTLTLVVFGMLARLLLGAILGLLAGWQRGSWFDRLVSGATGIWAAFPATLFAMIVIQALGIQQGMWVFVAAISLVGWGEVAQVVRGQVISLKPQAFVEAARSIGARADQVLMRHILPNLVNHLTVLAVLEMGGILMLLAELGFLNIFMGGGFRAIIGEAGGMVPVVATYSDVPEWSALIANVRQYWRSYSWMALYPGLAVFLSIMAFNLFGEGLRRFLQENAIGLGRFLNRYTMLGAAGLALTLGLILRSSAPLNQYRSDALRFDEGRVMEDIRVLSEPQLQGRETGTAGADLAAIYIGQRMAEMGLAPAGEHQSYYQRLVQPRTHLNGVPELSVLDDSGNTALQFEYRSDFAEVARYTSAIGEADAPIMGVAYGPMIEGEDNSQFGLGNSPAMDHVLIVRADDVSKVALSQVLGLLLVVDDENELLRRDLYPYYGPRFEEHKPIAAISPRVADILLNSAGSSLAELDSTSRNLNAGSMQLTAPGVQVHLKVGASRSENLLDEAYVNVMGVIPGQGYMLGADSQVIVVSAYYDGVGTDPLGLVFPGANDNASGVAVMLELARTLKESAYQPDKTVLFVAWAGGERQEGLSVKNILNARPGANDLTVETVIELSGVGYGTGSSISIGNESSYRLVQLFQQAAKRYDARTTTLGRGPHFDLPVASMFGGRDATTLALAWDGSDHLAHTAADTFALIDPAKLAQIGRSTYLTLLVLSREAEY